MEQVHRHENEFWHSLCPVDIGGYEVDWIGLCLILIILIQIVMIGKKIYENYMALNHALEQMEDQMTQNEESDDLDKDKLTKDSDNQAQSNQGEDSEAGSKNAMTEEGSRTQINKFIIESRCCMQ